MQKSQRGVKWVREKIQQNKQKFEIKKNKKRRQLVLSNPSKKPFWLEGLVAG